MSGLFTHLVSRTLATGPVLVARLPQGFKSGLDAGEPLIELEEEVPAKVPVMDAPAPLPTIPAPLSAPAEPASASLPDHAPMTPVRPPQASRGHAQQDSRPAEEMPAPAPRAPNSGPPAAGALPSPTLPAATPPAPAAAEAPITPPRHKPAASRPHGAAPVPDPPLRGKPPAGMLVLPQPARTSPPSPTHASPANGDPVVPRDRAGDLLLPEAPVPVLPPSGGPTPGALATPMLWPSDARQSAPPPDVVISIGLVDVRASPPVQPLPGPPRTPRPQPLSLADYLARRGSGGR